LDGEELAPAGVFFNQPTLFRSKVVQMGENLGSVSCAEEPPNPREGWLSLGRNSRTLKTVGRPKVVGGGDTVAPLLEIRADNPYAAEGVTERTIREALPSQSVDGLYN
jgi:hypothetical protein